MKLPGDPEMVRVAARALAMAATESDATRTHTSQAHAGLTVDAAAWTGGAADQFSVTVSDNEAAFYAYASACAKASQTLSVYAEELAAAHAAADRANAIAESVGATLDDEGGVVITPALEPTIGMPRDPVTEAAAQNAGREALFDLRNAARRAVAGLHGARHELMPRYRVGALKLPNYLDLGTSVYAAGIAISNSPWYMKLRNASKRRAHYWEKKVGTTRGANYAKLFADRAEARAARFAETARAAQRLGRLPWAEQVGSDVAYWTRPGSKALRPVLSKVPVAGLAISAYGTYAEIRSGAEPVTEVTAAVGSLAVGAFATQAAVAGLVALGMAGAAPVLVGAAVGAAVAWGVGEGIKWLAHTQAGQDAIRGAKEAAGDVADGLRESAENLKDGVGRLGGALGSLFKR
jgi:hypothetical protein